MSDLLNNYNPILEFGPRSSSDCEPIPWRKRTVENMNKFSTGTPVVGSQPPENC